MEFPHLGQHCTLKTCKQLDFLPMQCDACSETFCKDHVRYADHSCEQAYKKVNQVPICPLCHTPVPVPRGEQPDIKVGEHIDRDCQSDPAVKKRNAFVNKCSVKGCKQKELIKVQCESCRENFCLKHRHEQDHSCSSLHTAKPISSTSRERKVRPTQQGTSTLLQPSTLNEDEALAFAIQASLNVETGSNHTTKEAPRTLTAQEEEDLALAQALVQSEKEESERQLAEQGRSEKKLDCKLS
ncbi:AN1-type zinc finger protein 2A-like [Actinia tenebrosa]|uniref:AN1-type zinc finger protein 2A-like n=1 Tax=Actinia tenebrosa TaxID=6105 RepID=A0A6P8J0X5_ACTTE|nr:AN1-type zinc finger protein 2A-like [Actinia tenebrosa]